MGKPHTYIRIFKPLQIYDHKFWVRLENALIRYGMFVKNNPIPESKFSIDYWYWPLQSKPRRDLYNIIIYIAKLTGVKIMWKFGIETFDKEFQYLAIIGENTRVIICVHIMNYIIEGIFKFEDYVKKNEKGKVKFKGYPTIVSYLRVKVWNKVKEINFIIDIIYRTEQDEKKTLRLENYIMGQYKLDYKKYGQIYNTYKIAISTYFYPRRMML